MSDCCPLGYLFYIIATQIVRALTYQCPRVVSKGQFSSTCTTLGIYIHVPFIYLLVLLLIFTVVRTHTHLKQGKIMSVYMAVQVQTEIDFLRFL